jgi:Lipocalin-like domain
MYDKTGHMCVTLANPNPLHWEDPAKPSDSERALTHKSMEAYCGTYEVREKEGRVIHRPELAEWPNYIGSDQVRNFHIEGDRLILSLEETPPNGEKRRSQITWERVSAASLPSTQTAETGFGSDQTRKTTDISTRLIGSWKQVSDEETLPNGSVVRQDEIGLVTYDASGHMSEQVMRRSASDVQVPSDSIYLNNGFDAYFGTYTIDEAKHTITHRVEGSVARQLVGKDLVRSFAFEGDRLTLKPTNGMSCSASI